MDEQRQTIANLLVSDDPADHAQARELHARLIENSYVCGINTETGFVFFIEPTDLTLRERFWMALWTLCCCIGAGLGCWAIAIGLVAIFQVFNF